MSNVSGVISQVSSYCDDLKSQTRFREQQHLECAVHLIAYNGVFSGFRTNHPNMINAIEVRYFD